MTGRYLLPFCKKFSYVSAHTCPFRRLTPPPSPCPGTAYGFHSFLISHHVGTACISYSFLTSRHVGMACGLYSFLSQANNGNGFFISVIFLFSGLDLLYFLIFPVRKAGSVPFLWIFLFFRSIIKKRSLCFKGVFYENIYDTGYG